MRFAIFSEEFSGYSCLGDKKIPLLGVPRSQKAQHYSPGFPGAFWFLGRKFTGRLGEKGHLPPREKEFQSIRIKIRIHKLQLSSKS